MAEGRRETGSFYGVPGLLQKGSHRSVAGTTSKEMTPANTFQLSKGKNRKNSLLKHHIDYLRVPGFHEL
ncbi:hypothetical protein V6N13_051826 [Hibiscus sabdariffa]